MQVVLDPSAGAFSFLFVQIHRPHAIKVTSVKVAARFIVRIRVCTRSTFLFNLQCAFCSYIVLSSSNLVTSSGDFSAVGCWVTCIRLIIFVASVVWKVVFSRFFS